MARKRGTKRPELITLLNVYGFTYKEGRGWALQIKATARRNLKDPKEYKEFMRRAGFLTMV